MTQRPPVDVVGGRVCSRKQGKVNNYFPTDFDQLCLVIMTRTNATRRELFSNRNEGSEVSQKIFFAFFLFLSANSSTHHTYRWTLVATGSHWWATGGPPVGHWWLGMDRPPPSCPSRVRVKGTMLSKPKSTQPRLFF